MKKLFFALIILCSIGINAQTFFIADSLTAKGDANFHTLYRYIESANKEYDFITIKIKLASADDSVAVKTSLSDDNSYSYVGLKDQLSYETVGNITGGTTDIWRGYLVLYSPRAPYIKIECQDSTLSGTVHYRIEAR